MGSTRGPSVGRALLAMTCRMRGADILGTLKRIQRAPFRSPDEIRDGQLRDVRALLAHAETLVPYYRTLFRNLGVRSQEIRDWDDFARLPILTKDIIREEERNLIREDVPVETIAEAFQRWLDGRSAEVLSQPRIHGEQRCRELSQP